MFRQSAAKMKLSVRERKKRWFTVLFLSPSLILFTAILIFPIFQTCFISLMKWDGLSAMKFNGLDNYKYIFAKTTDFRVTLRNTIIAPIICNVIQIPIALVLAFMVYRCKRGTNFFQAVYFIPVILSSTIMAVLFFLFFNGEIGPLNIILRAIGIAKPPSWLSDPKITLYTVLLPAVWQYIGYFFVIILAGMQSIPEEIVESATIDGANSFKVFTKIAVPLSKDIIQICIVLNTIGAMKSFDLSFIMTAGGPGVSSSFLAVLMYKYAHISNNYGRASAVAFVMLVVALVSTMLLNWSFGVRERMKERKRIRLEGVN